MKPINRTMPLLVCHPEQSESAAKRTIRAAEGPLRFVRGLWERVNSARRLSAVVLHEIFDQGAYERFLSQHQLAPGAAAYADFCREQQQSKARRPRCC